MHTITYSASASVSLSPSRTCGAYQSGGVPAKEKGVVAGDLAWPVRGLIPALAWSPSAPPRLRYSDLGWAAMWAQRYSAADSSPAYSGPARSLGMALKKEIKFPPGSKAP